MISRRNFLIYTSLTPLITYVEEGQALGVEKSTPVTALNSHLAESLDNMDFAIEGWVANDCDTSKTRIIRLSTSWKSDWL
jgi:uncharacterized protein YgfB (UPF0149 family)